MMNIQFSTSLQYAMKKISPRSQIVINCPLVILVPWFQKACHSNHSCRRKYEVEFSPGCSRPVKFILFIISIVWRQYTTSKRIYSCTLLSHCCVGKLANDKQQRIFQPTWLEIPALSKYIQKIISPNIWNNLKHKMNSPR